MAPRVTGLIVMIGALLVGCSTPAATPSTSPTSATSAGPSAVGPSASAAPSASDAPAGWTELNAADGPPARFHHTWTVDGDGRIAYLFGGRDSSGALGDLWAFDLSTDSWTLLSESGAGPPNRFGHDAVWVPGTGLVIFGGQVGNIFFNDLWAYSPADGWRQLPAGGAPPVPRYGSCAALGPDGRLWISHGFTQEGSRFADTRSYDFATKTWTEETPVGERPVERCLHRCWLTDDGTLVLYGGQTTGVTALGDFWRLTLGPRPGTNAWAEGSLSEAPPARNRYAATRTGPSTLIFGGQDIDGSDLGDLWVVADDGTATTVILESGASPRYAAELVTDPATGRFLLFGGNSDGSAMGDLWQLVLPPSG